MKYFWHVIGDVYVEEENRNFFTDYSCEANDFFDAVKQAEEYGVKNIVEVHRGSEVKEKYE